MSAPTYYPVARASELLPGEVVAVSVAGVDMVLYRHGAEIYAAQRRCLHQGGDLADGIVSRGFLICAHHGWRFHAGTGVHDMSAQNCLITYRVRVAGDVVEVDPTPVYRAEEPHD